jgi:pimeloyl-ACP methyl ester carboxylesterase
MPAERWLGRPLAETRGWLELARLLADPVFRGAGVPHGDGRPVVLMPGFLAGDQTLSVIAAWLQRLGYRPRFCGFVLNAGCSDRTLDRLERRVDALWRSYGRRVALIGHSRGGHFARALAARRPDRVSHAISMGADLQGLSDPPRPRWWQLTSRGASSMPAAERAKPRASAGTVAARSATTSQAVPVPAGAAHEHLLKGRRSRPLAMPGDPRRRLHRGDRQPHRARLQPQGLPGGGGRVGAARVAPGRRSPQPRAVTFDPLRRSAYASDRGVVVGTRRLSLCQGEFARTICISARRRASGSARCAVSTDARFSSACDREGLAPTRGPATAVLADASRSRCQRQPGRFDKQGPPTARDRGPRWNNPRAPYLPSCRTFLNAAERAVGCVADLVRAGASGRDEQACARERPRGEPRQPDSVGVSR